MTRKIEVNTGTLKSDVDSINSELGSLRREIHNLRDVTSALGMTWEGDAKNAFMAAISDDIEKLEQLVDEVEKYTGRTSDARIEYDGCENSVAQIIAGIKV